MELLCKGETNKYYLQRTHPSGHRTWTPHGYDLENSRGFNVVSLWYMKSKTT